MNDYGGAIFIQQRMIAIAQLCAGYNKAERAGAIGLHIHIGQVATMVALGVIQTMLGHHWVPMSSSRLEIGCIAFPGHMDMRAMRACTDTRHGNGNRNAPTFLHQTRLSYVLAFGVLQNRDSCRSRHGV